MPLVRVTMTKGKSTNYIEALSKSIYESLVETFRMPENDLFQIIEQLEPGSLIFDRRIGIDGERSDDFLFINIESSARSREEKQALIARLAEKLVRSPGLSPNDVFVRLSNNSLFDDFSFGGGLLASDSPFAPS